LVAIAGASGIIAMTIIAGGGVVEVSEAIKKVSPYCRCIFFFSTGSNFFFILLSLHFQFDLKDLNQLFASRIISSSFPSTLAGRN